MEALAAAAFISAILYSAWIVAHAAEAGGDAARLWAPLDAAGDPCPEYGYVNGSGAVECTAVCPEATAGVLRTYCVEFPLTLAVVPGVGAPLRVDRPGTLARLAGVGAGVGAVVSSAFTLVLSCAGVWLVLLAVFGLVGAQAVGGLLLLESASAELRTLGWVVIAAAVLGALVCSAVAESIVVAGTVAHDSARLVACHPVPTLLPCGALGCEAAAAAAGVWAVATLLSLSLAVAPHPGALLARGFVPHDGGPAGGVALVLGTTLWAVVFVHHLHRAVLAQYLVPRLVRQGSEPSLGRACLRTARRSCGAVAVGSLLAVVMWTTATVAAYVARRATSLGVRPPRSAAPALRAIAACACCTALAAAAVAVSAPMVYAAIPLYRCSGRDALRHVARLQSHSPTLFGIVEGCMRLLRVLNLATVAIAAVLASLAVGGADPLQHAVVVATAVAVALVWDIAVIAGADAGLLVHASVELEEEHRPVFSIDTDSKPGAGLPPGDVEVVAEPGRGEPVAAHGVAELAHVQP